MRNSRKNCINIFTSQWQLDHHIFIAIFEATSESNKNATKIIKKNVDKNSHLVYPQQHTLFQHIYPQIYGFILVGKDS